MALPSEAELRRLDVLSKPSTLVQPGALYVLVFEKGFGPGFLLLDRDIFAALDKSPNFLPLGGVTREGSAIGVTVKVATTPLDRSVDQVFRSVRSGAPAFGAPSLTLRYVVPVSSPASRGDLTAAAATTQPFRSDPLGIRGFFTDVGGLITRGFSGIVLLALLAIAILFLLRRAKR